MQEGNLRYTSPALSRLSPGRIGRCSSSIRSFKKKKYGGLCFKIVLLLLSKWLHIKNENSLVGSAQDALLSVKEAGIDVNLMGRAGLRGEERRKKNRCWSVCTCLTGAYLSPKLEKRTVNEKKSSCPFVRPCQRCTGR